MPVLCEHWQLLLLPLILLGDSVLSPEPSPHRQALVSTSCRFRGSCCQSLLCRGPVLFCPLLHPVNSTCFGALGLPAPHLPLRELTGLYCGWSLDGPRVRILLSFRNSPQIRQQLLKQTGMTLLSTCLSFLPSGTAWELPHGNQQQW